MACESYEFFYVNRRLSDLAFSSSLPFPVPRHEFINSFGLRLRHPNSLLLSALLMCLITTWKVQEDVRLKLPLGMISYASLSYELVHIPGLFSMRR
jgi:hypothetical protein